MTTDITDAHTRTRACCSKLARACTSKPTQPPLHPPHCSKPPNKAHSHTTQASPTRLHVLDERRPLLFRVHIRSRPRQRTHPRLCATQPTHAAPTPPRPHRHRRCLRRPAAAGATRGLLLSLPIPLALHPVPALRPPHPLAQSVGRCPHRRFHLCPRRRTAPDRRPLRGQVSHPPPHRRPLRPQHRLGTPHRRPPRRPRQCLLQPRKPRPRRVESVQALIGQRGRPLQRRRQDLAGLGGSRGVGRLTQNALGWRRVRKEAWVRR